jgi:dipeptidyl aminopeptidase/acylaminoacyl peptidase
VRLSRLALSLFITLILSVSPTLAQTDASSWTLVDERRMEANGAPYQISPDGDWLAGPGSERGTVCVWAIETLDETCSPKLVPLIHPGSIRWSPDSTAVAFGMHAKSLTMRSDIYIYELDAGAITNLTENQPGVDGDEPGETLFSHYWNPAWSPDGQDLAFTEITHDASGEETVRLVTTPRSGGEILERAVLGDSDSSITDSPISWQEDGTVILSIWSMEGEDPANGIWRVTPDGNLSQVLVADEASGVWLPYLVDVSADGARASMYSVGAYAQDNVGPGTTFFVVDLATGEAQSWEEILGLDLNVSIAESPEGTGVLISAPVFSPDGSSAVFMTRMANDSVDVHVMNEDGSVVRLTTIPPFEGKLSENETFLAGTPPNLSWADNNTVLALTDYDTVILTLEP